MKNSDVIEVGETIERV